MAGGDIHLNTVSTGRCLSLNCLSLKHTEYLSAQARPQQRLQLSQKVLSIYRKSVQLSKNTKNRNIQSRVGVANAKTAFLI